ncbi:MAG: ribosomal-processing cysteine protease Prp [Spirochaetes bacterium]|nr:ribosomal-processing cysteine protease Prp [Spirochaetota bacterium]
MIDVAAQISDGRLASLTICGHAAPKGAAGYEVCVAASVLAQGMVKALKALKAADFTLGKAKGDFVFRVTGVRDVTKYDVITAGFLAALKDLAAESPDYMNFNERRS